MPCCSSSALKPSIQAAARAPEPTPISSAGISDGKLSAASSSLSSFQNSVTESATASGWFASDAARERRLKTAARRRFPLAQVLPEQPVEVPDHAIAVGPEIIQVDAAVVGGRGRADAPQRAPQLQTQLGGSACRRSIAISASDIGCLRVGGATDDDRIAEIGLLVDPVEMHPQRRRQARIEDAVLDEVHERSGDEAGQLAKLRRFPGLFLGL